MRDRWAGGRWVTYAFAVAALVWSGCAKKRAPERADERTEAKKVGAQTVQETDEAEAAPETPKRIILLIGDGMGAS
ncbi:MAG: hypothetical protein ABEK29_03020, partial [Bradymonadaceae bacterium]